MQISGIKKSTLLDYPGKVATLIFTPGCNLRCGYCHNREFVLPEEIKKIKKSFISEEVFFRFLRSRIGFLDGVVICGGEPTIHMDLTDFCMKIKDLGFLVKLDTNGTRPNIIKKLLKQNLVDYIAMDIKQGLSGSKYSNLIGVNIENEIFQSSIDIIKNYAPNYEFRTTVIGGIHTSETIEEIAKNIEGAKQYYLQNYRDGHTLDPNFQGESVAPSVLVEWQKIAKKYVEKCSIRN
ncbi:anaerobic ribonucleoside-triphosphate reductase activating protein [Candidatus Gracilibacteria bacterium]|nr:anaerobic ribonucleoside-triphosphate reductase activating protein [Candidatus Gracilibacteria bacterium]